MNVSVIIPAHQEEKYIGNTLKSVIGKDAEVIVVANACTDRTVDVARRYASDVIEADEKGVSKARNAGARKASGDMLVFLDADISITEDTIRKILDSGYDIGTCYAKPDVDKIVPKMMMRIKNVAHHFGSNTGLIFCTKELYGKVGGFDESMDFGEDGRFLRQAKALGKFGVADTYVINSMRRFEKKGYMKVLLFWIRNRFISEKKGYEVVR
ncbi:MAG: glycosyltransferase [Nanoarchaeota archaeon]